MFLKCRPNTAYRTPVTTRNAKTPIDTPSPIDAATPRPGLGCGVVEDRGVAGDAESDDDVAIIVWKVNVKKEVFDSTDDFSSSSVWVATVVGLTTVSVDVEVGTGALNVVRTVLSVVVLATSDRWVVTSEEVSASTAVLATTSTVVMKVVAGSIDMTIGVSPPIFVDVDIEGSWDDVMRVIGQCHAMLHQNGIVRIQSDIRVGSRTDKEQKFKDKVEAVEKLLKEDQGAAL
ncbi:hypothetical protein G6011_03356 [Alternaria panax]|uniref:Thiamine-binding protein domain-containing protein n=1 Tax=Alternaria panax TaxID=48097 RepID=A0AAD4IF71_9PLEO|nr:hypothetical protein G6011_03356 [Alternaria panax]